MTYKMTKTFGHEIGLSCAFRQWRATHSHCSKLHGYAIAVRIEFEADSLDSRNWVVDFGGLKTLKHRIEGVFDHKTVVAEDDPLLNEFQALKEKGAIDLVVLKDVGCEKFSEVIYNLVVWWLEECNYAPRVRVKSVTVSEHGANSATYEV